MRNLVKINVKSVVSVIAGTAIFAWMFMYVKLPTGIPNTDIQMACGIGAFFSAVMGPVAGAVISFVGHAISDTLQSGSPWWSWVIASGVASYVTGLVYPKLKNKFGNFERNDVIRFNIFQIAGNIFAWVIIAPVLDMLIYSEGMKLAFTQGIVAAISNSMATGVIGTVLLEIYNKMQKRDNKTA